MTLLKKSEAAKVLRISEELFMGLIKSKAIPSVRLGKRKTLYSAEAIEAFIAKGGLVDAKG